MPVPKPIATTLPRFKILMVTKYLHDRHAIPLANKTRTSLELWQNEAEIWNYFLWAKAKKEPNRNGTATTANNVSLDRNTHNTWMEEFHSEVHSVNLNIKGEDNRTTALMLLRMKSGIAGCRCRIASASGFTTSLWQETIGHRIPSGRCNYVAALLK